MYQADGEDRESIFERLGCESIHSDPLGKPSKRECASILALYLSSRKPQSLHSYFVRENRLDSYRIPTMDHTAASPTSDNGSLHMACTSSPLSPAPPVTTAGGASPAPGAPEESLLAVGEDASASAGGDSAVRISLKTPTIEALVLTYALWRASAPGDASRARKGRAAKELRAWEDRHVYFRFEDDELSRLASSNDPKLIDRVNSAAAATAHDKVTFYEGLITSQMARSMHHARDYAALGLRPPTDESKHFHFDDLKTGCTPDTEREWTKFDGSTLKLLAAADSPDFVDQVKKSVASDELQVEILERFVKSLMARERERDEAASSCRLPRSGLYGAY